MSWRGEDGGIAAAKAGHDAVMTPTDYCYFDYYQASPKTEPVAIGGFTTLKKVFEYEPVPAEISETESRHILGAQGNLWTEYIPVPRHAEYMSVPRMCALAEVVWSPRGGRSWEDFQKRLDTHFRRLYGMGVNFSQGSFHVDIATELRDGVPHLVLLGAEDQMRHTIPKLGCNVDVK